MRNPNADSFDKFCDESLADELIRFFKKKTLSKTGIKNKKVI